MENDIVVPEEVNFAEGVAKLSLTVAAVGAAWVVGVYGTAAACGAISNWNERRKTKKFEKQHEEMLQKEGS